MFLTQQGESVMLEQINRGIFTSHLQYPYEPEQLPDNGRWTSTRLNVTEYEAIANWLIALARHHGRWVGVAIEEVPHILNTFRDNTNIRMRLFQQRIGEVVQQMCKEDFLCITEQDSTTIMLPTKELLERAIPR